MRLLTLPVTIARVPIQLGYGAAKEAVKLVQGLARGGEETVAEQPQPKPASRPKPAPRRKPARRSANGRSRGTASMTPPPPEPVAEAETAAPAEPVVDVETAAPAEPAAEAEPAPAEPVAEPEPAHVSEEPELVAETAEAGAEDGAGAEVAVEEPWPGYDQMRAAEIEDRLVAEGVETAAAVSLYEASRKGRASVLEAASRSMSG
jgi:hypothetical protein